MFLAQKLPPAPVYRAAEVGARLASRRSTERTQMGERHLARIEAYRASAAGAHLKRLPGAAGAPRPGSSDSSGIADIYSSYARYWVDSFRLPAVAPAELDGNFSYEGYEHIKAAREAGVGPIIALPHLGGWEWAAYWLSVMEQVPVSAVVERLEPEDLFEWFVDYRESLGMEVIPLGPKVASRVSRALKDRNVLCLLSDRDLEGTGIEVEFFGERTTLPAGPATLSLRLKAPILPSAIYFRDGGVFAHIGSPLDTSREGSLREDVSRITQALAHRLEELIGAAPEQWHVLQPLWPSDHLR